MKLELLWVPAAYIDDMWYAVKPFLVDGISDCDAEYGIDDIRNALLEGQWKLCIAIDEQETICGAASVSFIGYPKEFVGFVTSIGGKILINQDTVDQLKELLRGQGATRIQGHVQEPFARMVKRYGFKKAAVLIEVKL